MYTQEEYIKKIINFDDLVSIIQPGGSIFISSGPAIPSFSVKNLISSDKFEGYDLKIIQLFTIGDFFDDDKGESSKYRLVNFRIAGGLSNETDTGRTDFVPSNLKEIPYIFESGAVDIDVAIITTSRPDRHGYMSLGIAIDVAQIILRKAKIVIAEINPHMPITYGETTVHVDQVHNIIESNEPLLERERKEYGDAEDEIGSHISKLIEDGSTVILHAGSIFDAIASHIKGKKDIGIYTNVISDWVIDLIESGTISFNRERSSGGLVSTSYCYGTSELYKYIDQKQIFRFYPISQLADPYRIRNVSNLVSIMNVEKIDITASTVVFFSTDDLLSGFQSKFNFAVGTALSDSGKVIFAIRSTDREGKSNIVISHDSGMTRLRSTLNIIRYVVTEYGIADLFGKTVRERVHLLIGLAHPNHRENLLSEAKENGYIF
ncbi:acetyl-CoA hydrolase/transferase family protein [Spirochaetota bacterium]